MARSPHHQPGLNQSYRGDSAHSGALWSNLESESVFYPINNTGWVSYSEATTHYIEQASEGLGLGLTLAFITDSWCSNTGGMEVATTVHITFNTAENQSGRVGRPAKGTFTLKPRAAAALALTTLIVASVGGVKSFTGSTAEGRTSR